MRYFLVGVLLTVVAVLSIAGFRGTATERPPFEIFPDMDRQLKALPQSESRFYADGRASRPPVSGTVARGDRYRRNPVNTGRESGSTNFVATIPVEVTAELLQEGRQRFGIYCAPCHGASGDGDGITTQYGMGVIADLHDYEGRQLVRRPAGDLFDVITNGRGVMGAYGTKLSVRERWAVIAYMRALQRSRLATVEEVPEVERANLE